MLACCVENSFWDGAKALIDAGVPVDEPLLDGGSILGMALKRGNAHGAKLIMSWGASVNNRTGNGLTPMMQGICGAAFMPEMVEWLLSAGSKLDEVCNQGYGALDYAVLHGRLAVAQELASRGAKVDGPGLRIAASRAEDWIGRCLSWGYEVDSVDGKGQSALFKAAHAGFEKGVGELLAAGADLLRLDKHGKSALDLALGGRKMNLAMRLVALGAPLGVDERGRHPTLDQMEQGYFKAEAGLIRQALAARSEARELREMVEAKGAKPVGPGKRL